MASVPAPRAPRKPVAAPPPRSTTSSTTSNGCARRRTPRSSRTSRPRTPTPSAERAPRPGSARRSSTRSRGARRRPTSACPCAKARGGTTRAPSRGSSTASTAALRSAGPTTGRRRRSPPTPGRRRAGAARRQRRGRGHRLLLARQLRRVGRRDAARLGPSTRRATSATCCASATSRPARDLDDGWRTPRPGAVLDGPGGTSSTRRSTTSWRPDTIWRHEVGSDAADDVVVFTEPDERFWVGVGTHPQPPVPRGRHRLEDHERGAHPRRERPDGRVRASCGRVARASSTRSSTRWSPAGPPAHRAQRRRRGLRAGRRAAPTSPLDDDRRARRGRTEPRPPDRVGRRVRRPPRRSSTAVTACPGGRHPARRRRLRRAVEVAFDEPLFPVGTGGNPESASPRAARLQLVRDAVTVFDYDVRTAS